MSGLSIAQWFDLENAGQLRRGDDAPRKNVYVYGDNDNVVNRTSPIFNITSDLFNIFSSTLLKVKIHSEHEKDPLDVPEEHRANVEVDQVVNADKADGNEDELEADIVVPVPDSGNAAALGYAQERNIPFDLGLIRNHYVGRTFIEPSQKIRSLGVKLKLNANETTIKNKKIILVDDSLVRGTTSLKIVKMLYDAGAKEVHVRIACPEIKYPDFYGVDTPTKKELLAANKSNDEICEYIGAKSLKFLSINGLYRAIGFDKRNETYPQLTDHYFTGDYPIKPVDELGDSKITQLSLLSSVSNN